MTSLSKSVQTHTGSVSEERSSVLKETLQFAYSHGLETIYALETIDIKTIRTMSALTDIRKGENVLPTYAEEYFEEQLTLDLGPYFRNWIPSMVKHEPIQVLEFGKHVEKALLERNIRLIGDIERLFLTEMSLTRGLGQGHLEEIRRKSSDYLKKNAKNRMQAIDFLSFLKCLFGDLDRRKTFVALEPFELEDWLSLTPMEKMEIKRISKETREEWALEIHKELKTGKKGEFLEQQFRLLVETWLMPWMDAREGYATEEELEEVLLLRSSQEKIGKKVLDLLQNFITVERFLPLFEGVFSSRESVCQKLVQIVCLAKTYFKHPASFYFLDELCAFIHAEFAKRWVSIWPSEIKKVLKLCPLFRVYRDSSGEWLVGLTSDLCKKQ